MGKLNDHQLCSFTKFASVIILLIYYQFSLSEISLGFEVLKLCHLAVQPTVLGQYMNTTFLGNEAYLLPYFICSCSPLRCAICVWTAVSMQFLNGAPTAIGHSLYTSPEAQLFLVLAMMSLTLLPSMDFGISRI